MCNYLVSWIYVFYGCKFQNTPKVIPLQCAEIAETTIDKKQNAFRIKPKDTKRIYYLHADDENTQHNWMQAICFAKAASRTGDNSQACILQWLIIWYIHVHFHYYCDRYWFWEKWLSKICSLYFRLFSLHPCFSWNLFSLSVW